MSRNFEGPFASITRDGIDPIAARTERMLNEAADFIAATHKQPADQRAWDHLLVYAPPSAVFNRLVKLLNYDGPDTDSLTLGEIRRALP